MTSFQDAAGSVASPTFPAPAHEPPPDGDPESRGWSLRAGDCLPKVRALATRAAVPPADPLPAVSYASKGNLLVVGTDERAVSAAVTLSASLPVTLLLTSRPSIQAEALARVDPSALAFPIWAGRVTALRGHLGNFSATLADLASVRAGGLPPPAGASAALFDLVVDFSEPPLFGHHQPPQGYWRVGNEAALATALAEAPAAVGEFEKPRFFTYRENLCAHARSGIEGCRRCLDVCSTEAIAADGDRVVVDPHLCMGCGACASVCPSGAMGYQFPRLSDRGVHLKAMAAAFREAGGREPCFLFHNGTDGREALAGTVAAGRGIPARVVPVESWHVASVGVDLLLGAVALGANQVAVLAAGSEAPEYLASLREQLALAQSIVSALGYEGRHFVLLEAGDPVALADALEALAPASVPASPAVFALPNDKRTAVEFAVDHLVRHAPSRVESIALAAGAPWGEVRVDRDKCTLCLACAGACPESALMDGTEAPQLRFLERNCVQCGLCRDTCPEEAIELVPRLLLTPSVRETRVLNEAEPFHCIGCGKPFGTKQMVDAMIGRLAGHAMFADGAALRRLQMCADCRVVDMMAGRNETSVLGL